MEEFKGTPAPWTYDDLNTGKVPYIRGGKFIIGSLCLTDGITPEMDLKEQSEANAKLISTAPELLEALQRFVAFADKQIQRSEDKYESSLIRDCKAAITKALTLS